MEEAPVTSEFNEGIHNACDTMDLREPEADSGRNQTDNAQISFEQQPSSLYSNSLDPTPLPVTNILQPASMERDLVSQSVLQSNITKGQPSPTGINACSDPSLVHSLSDIKYQPAVQFVAFESQSPPKSIESSLAPIPQSPSGHTDSLPTEVSGLRKSSDFKIRVCNRLMPYAKMLRDGLKDGPWLQGLRIDTGHHLSGIAAKLYHLHLRRF